MIRGVPQIRLTSAEINFFRQLLTGEQPVVPNLIEILSFFKIN
jgi:hypothetical protein